MIRLATAQDTEALGRHIGQRLRAGDLVLLAGELGAGKTTLTKGIAVGMGLTARITSPTFVLARVHRADDSAAADVEERPALVHVDAYRLGGRVELDDLDLDTDLARAAVVVEWGTGVAEQISDAYLLVELVRLTDDSRQVTLHAVGGDWAARLRDLVQPDPASID